MRQENRYFKIDDEALAKALESPEGQIVLGVRRAAALERAAEAYGQMRKEYLKEYPKGVGPTPQASLGKGIEYASTVKTLKEEWGFTDEEIWKRAQQLGLE